MTHGSQASREAGRRERKAGRTRKAGTGIGIRAGTGIRIRARIIGGITVAAKACGRANPVGKGKMRGRALIGAAGARTTPKAGVTEDRFRTPLLFS